MDEDRRGSAPSSDRGRLSTITTGTYRLKTPICPFKLALEAGFVLCVEGVGVAPLAWRRALL